MESRSNFPEKKGTFTFPWNKKTVATSVVFNRIEQKTGFNKLETYSKISKSKFVWLIREGTEFGLLSIDFLKEKKPELESLNHTLNFSPTPSLTPTIELQSIRLAYIPSMGKWEIISDKNLDAVKQELRNCRFVRQNIEQESVKRSLAFLLNELRMGTFNEDTLLKPTKEEVSKNYQSINSASLSSFRSTYQL